MAGARPHESATRRSASPDCAPYLAATSREDQLAIGWRSASPFSRASAPCDNRRRGPVRRPLSSVCATAAEAVLRRRDRTGTWPEHLGCHYGGVRPAWLSRGGYAASRWRTTRSKYKGEQVEVALFGGEYQEGVLTAYCYVEDVAHIELNGHILVPLQNIASLHCSSRCDAPERRTGLRAGSSHGKTVISPLDLVRKPVDSPSWVLPLLDLPQRVSPVAETTIRCRPSARPSAHGHGCWSCHKGTSPGRRHRC